MFHNTRLRLALLAFLIITVLGSTITPLRQAKAISTPWLTVSGRYINDPSGNHVILRGLSMVDVWVSDLHVKNSIALTNQLTDSSQGWYARVIRFPVYPNAIDGSAGWIAGPDTYFNNHLNPAIQNCVAKQIYCIIDWHYITDYNNSTVDTATRNFWSYIAPKYANTPNVIFELYNEPINPDNWSTWKAAAQPWVNIIRAAAPNNLILIGGPRWSQNVAEAATNPFSGGNIAYVAHIYPQHGGQSTWDSWFGNSSNTVPYFITEFGWQNGGGNPTSGTTSGFGIPFYNYLEAKGVSWTAWVYDPWWQPIMMDTNWNLLGGENYMGQMTKDELAQHQNDNLPGGGGGVTNTPTRTPTVSGPTATRTRTPTVGGPTATRTRTPTVGGPTATRTRTPTQGTGPSLTPTRTFTPPPGITPTQGTGGTCSPVSATITAPFVKDGAGTLCWQSSSLGGYINSWNTTSVTINGVNITNLWIGSGSYPAKIGGFWYVTYNSSVAWGHFEAK